mgnify:CR=1 FL=1
MANYTVGNLAGTIPEIWGDIINEAFFPQFVLQRFATDLSEYAVDQGRIIHVPNAYTNVFTASTQTSGADIYSPAQVAATVDQTISITNHRFVAWVIGDLELNQLATKYNLNEVYAREAAAVLLQTLEDSLFALYASLTPTAIGTGVAAIDDLSVRQAIRTLANANFDLTQCAFFFSPTVYFDQLIGLSKISPNYASNMNVMSTGTLYGTQTIQDRAAGILYGQPVYISSRVPVVTTTTRNLYIHNRAFAYAVQGGSGSTGIRVQMSNELRLLGMLAVVDLRFGTGILRADGGVVINVLTAGTVA